MANQILGNIYILDTGSGNTSIPWNVGSRIQSVAFWSTDSTGLMELSMANTSQVIVKLANPNNADTTVGIYLGGLSVTEMKLPVLTAGTGWIYFV